MNGQTKAMLDAARIDKVDLLFEMEFDRWQDVHAALQGTFHAIADEAGVPLAFNSRCLGQSKDSGLRLYTVETWGPCADAVAKALPTKYYPNISRLDFRIEVDINAERLPDLTRFVEKEGRYGRNVSYFNTRERVKKEGRHAGGRGVAIGSHKSDSRMAVYKRKGEKGAIEVQISGDTARRLSTLAVDSAGQFTWETPYSSLRGYLAARMEKMAKASGFEDLSQMAAFVQVGGDVPDQWDVNEYNTFTAVTAFEALAPEDQEHLLNILVEKVRARQATT